MKTRKLIYEYEAERYTLNPYDFVERIRSDFFKKTNHLLSEWIESPKEFVEPFFQYDIYHQTGLFGETIQARALCCQREYYLTNHYQFKMEWKDGRGVCIAYLWELPPRKKLKKISKNFKKVLDKPKRK